MINLQAGQSVVLTSDGIPPVEAPVARPSVGNASQFNKWGFPGPPKPPPPLPPPPPPCPRPILSGGEKEDGLPDGWLKYPAHCGSNSRCTDGHDCGEDLCWPHKSNSVLCAPLHVPVGQRIEVVAANRCDTVVGCESFAVYSGQGQAVKWWNSTGSLTPDNAAGSPWVGWSKHTDL